MKRIYSLPTIALLASFLLTNFLANGQKLFTVNVTGKGQPMILIHGLFCSGEVWKETVEHYQNAYECHVITLAGFGGNAPALSDHFLESMKDEVITYVKDKKLKNPIIMGHSMGGFLSLWAAASAPDLFQKVIAVDGIPFLSVLANPSATPDNMKPMALNMKNSMAGQTPEQIKTNQQRILQSMITSPERISQVAEIASKADSPTQGEVMYEMFTTDLRPTVAAIQSPVLVMGQWAAYKSYGATHDGSVAAYQAQVANVKHATVAINDTAKHFIFYDEPAWFFLTVDNFLK
ncbi:alpha/beta fold hydrolase [Chryseolinea lacunae]|uniref:Alpha/beta hydrolase n=1 Tax=Chryseolinea lacunae TaxID=2801331 RepID=A0ABS1KYG5_9BACT|nr:alpha/beta hydrolase [Chryseolinea lacunae]MBL0744365.1 alpha/beta hydrolase [Chryseolinea lacunae]